MMKLAKTTLPTTDQAENNLRGHTAGYYAHTNSWPTETGEREMSLDEIFMATDSVTQYHEATMSTFGSTTEPSR